MIIFFVWSFCGGVYAQDTLRKDSTATENKALKKNHKPRTAALLSLVLPGAGQVYNRKYWKPPIIYAALGGVGYFFMKNQNQYTYYRKNLIALVKGDSSVIAKTGYTSDQLQTQKLTFRKYRDMFGFGLIAIYLVNIIDANVDAHLKSFDISDNLSLQIKPSALFFTSLRGMTCGAGLSIKLNFK